MDDRAHELRVFEGIEVGEGFTWEGLTVFPLRGPDLQGPDYVIAADAFQEGAIRVTEVSEQGAVQQLVVENDLGRPVLFLEGETLEGAKQNRTLNVTVMLAPRSRTPVPVSCVEAGRWRSTSRAFRYSPHVAHSKLRALKSRYISESLARARDYRGSQGEVWAEIHKKEAALRMRSPTAAIHELYDHVSGTQKPPLEELSEKLAGARGFIAFVGERQVVADVFDRAATFERYRERLIRSACFEALASRVPAAGVTRERATETLRRADEIPEPRRHPSPGMGTDARARDRELLRVALEVDGKPVHASVFSVEG